jgi:thiopeptide-type bacteriocin biosynthesis protein
MTPPYYFFPSLFLRTPLFSYAEHGAGDLQKAFADPWFLWAVYVASPEFYRQLAAKDFDLRRMNEKEQLSLWKYLNRMNFRPTPFGLFSAFTLAEWGSRGPVVLDEGAGKVHIRPDQELAGLIAAALARDPLADIFRLNPTLYLLAREFRFIKTFRGENTTRLSYSLESLGVNALTKELVRFFGGGCKGGLQIAGFLEQRTDCGRGSALEYIAFLREAGVLCSVMDANIIGREHLARVTGQPGDRYPGLRALATEFEALARDRGNTGPGQLPGFEERLKKTLAGYGIAEPGKYFYVNTERPARGAVDADHKEKLLSAVRALRRLVPGSGQPLLSQFAEDFKKRFDMARIPFLQAMDPDAGVGYGHFAEHSTAERLLKDIRFPTAGSGTRPVEWSAVHQLLLDKWISREGGPVRLFAADLETLPSDGALPLPPSLSVMFRITDDGLLIESAGGVTATALIGRFTLLSDEVWRAGKEIAALEIRANPDVVFAEIGQLSDVHADNINRRQPVYQYEIPANSVSMLPEDNQLGLRDLVVSVRDGEVILESLRLGKRVIPRLSSAYNFRQNHLAVFRFLCDLQYQSLQSALSFDLENYFPGMSSYPRVEYQGVILSPAKWHVKVPAEARLADLRIKLGLPACIALTRFDQQLIFDLDEHDTARFFAGCVRGMKEFTLQEFIPPPARDAPVVSEGGRPFVNQMIAFLLNPEKVYSAPPLPQPPKNVPRDFLPGSEWLYLKIYCTPQAADDILAGQVLPLISGLLKEGLESWFFIRYQDPGPHIRLRIKISEDRIAGVLRRLKNRFSGLVSNHMVREYQAGTYRREIERYGPGLIRAAEDLFRASSDLAIRFLKPGRKLGIGPDQLAISGMAAMLGLVLPVPGEQLRFLESVTAGFYREFNGDKNFRVELDSLYRGLKADFSVAAADAGLYRRLNLTRCNNRFKKAIGVLFSKERLSEARKHALLADVIHMHLNRIYAGRQREREMVLYYCFLKYTLSRAAVLKQSAVPAGVANI